MKRHKRVGPPRQPMTMKSGFDDFCADLGHFLLAECEVVNWIHAVDAISESAQLEEMLDEKIWKRCLAWRT